MILIYKILEYKKLKTIQYTYFLQYNQICAVPCLPPVLWPFSPGRTSMASSAFLFHHAKDSSLYTYQIPFSMDAWQFLYHGLGIPVKWMMAG